MMQSVSEAGVWKAVLDQAASILARMEAKGHRWQKWNRLRSIFLGRLPTTIRWVLGPASSVQKTQWQSPLRYRNRTCMRPNRKSVQLEFWNLHPDQLTGGDSLVFQVVNLVQDGRDPHLRWSKMKCRRSRARSRSLSRIQARSHQSRSQAVETKESDLMKERKWSTGPSSTKWFKTKSFRTCRMRFRRDTELI